MLMTKQSRNTMKPPAQTPSPPASSSLVFEGVYNNARMLHFLTAVVGATCDVCVKNGAVYEGIFKTLSSQCELAVDAVHKCSDGDGGGGREEGGGGGLSSTPKIEEITDTMIFSPTDLVTMTCRDVDLNFAVRDTFTDACVGSGRANGEHREKVLERWDGGGRGENFELESDSSNGWDASEMFRLNEEAYGIKSTYDSSLSTYTMPLERGSSELYRQREARAARLAGEIEGGLQYRRRVSLENDEGMSEEEKFSSVVREREGRPSPGCSSGVRDGKYVPRARVSAAAASSRHLPPGSASPKPPSDRSSPPSVRAASSPRPPQSSPPCSNHTLPQALAHSGRSSVNGVPLTMSPKCQRLQRNLRSCQSSSAVSRPPKADAPPKDLPLTVPPYLDSSPSTTREPSDPAPLFPVDVNEILAAKERAETLAPVEGRSSRAHTLQQRSQLDELRKFGKEFRLQPSFSSSSSDRQQTSAPPPSSSSSSSSCSSSPSSSSSSSPAPPKPVASFPPLLTSSIQDQTAEAAPPQPTPPPRRSEDGGARTEAAAKTSTLNPNAKEFLPVRGNAVTKPATTPTPPRPTPPGPPVALLPPGPQGGCTLYGGPPGQYLSYVSPITIQGHSIQAPQVYQYTAVSQGAYPRPKAPLVGPRPDHHAPPSLISAAASVAGPPLVAPPYPLSYLQYSQVIQAMSPHYHGQTVYSLLQGGGARMLTPGAPPQQMGPGPQFPVQAEGQAGPQQAVYAPQSTAGGAALPQHGTPSPGHAHAMRPAPANLPPGHSSPQASSYAMQGYGLPAHQPLPHAFPSIGLLAQAHVTGGVSGSHPSAGPGPPPLVLHYAAPQQGGSAQHGPPTQQGAPQHFYIGPPQAVQVPAHPSQQLSFHAPPN